jgi:hypothetical protein
MFDQRPGQNPKLACSRFVGLYPHTSGRIFPSPAEVPELPGDY